MVNTAEQEHEASDGTAPSRILMERRRRNENQSSSSSSIQFRQEAKMLTSKHGAEGECDESCSNDFARPVLSNLLGNGHCYKVKEWLNRTMELSISPFNNKPRLRTTTSIIMLPFPPPKWLPPQV